MDSTKPRDWLYKAKQDLESSWILLQNDGPEETIAFHAHQAIEKAMKAYIIFKTGELVEGHSLVYLNKLAAKQNNKFEKFKSDCVELNKYYLRTRYPIDMSYEVAYEDAKTAYEKANEIYKLVKEEIN